MNIEELGSCINWPVGKHHVVVIDTDSYAGNFERELAAYAAGAYDSDCGHGGRELAMFEDDAEDDPRLFDIQEQGDTQPHEEYGNVSNTIIVTPGTKPFAYHSVGIFFRRALTEEELSLVRERAVEYGNRPLGTQRPFNVHNIRQLVVNVGISVSEI